MLLKRERTVWRSLVGAWIMGLFAGWFFFPSCWMFTECLPNTCVFLLISDWVTCSFFVEWESVRIYSGCLQKHISRSKLKVGWEVWLKCRTREIFIPSVLLFALIATAHNYRSLVWKQTLTGSLTVFVGSCKSCRRDVNTASNCKQTAVIFFSSTCSFSSFL